MKLKHNKFATELRMATMNSMRLCVSHRVKRRGVAILSVVLFICSLISCGEQAPENSETTTIEVKELRDYDSLISENDLLLGVPVRLKIDHDTQHLFIQDVAHWAVIELDEQNNEVRRYGSRGRGPGEIQNLDDFFISAEHLFIVDSSRFLIHKYSRIDGQFISSLDYREFLFEKSNSSERGLQPNPQAPLTSNNNRPFISYNETVLLPALSSGKYLYRAITWEGENTAEIGEIPEGYNNFIDDEEVRKALRNKRLPAHVLPLAFPVNDPANLNEIFVVYSVIPKIAKYNLEGDKVWEQTVPYTPEVDSLMIDLKNVLQDQPNQRVSLLPVKKYMAGRSSPDGDVYLFTYTNLNTPHTPRRPMWIHQFDTEGKFIHRYKIISDTDLFYYPGIDFKNRRIFTPSFNESDIRIYPF